MEESQINTIEVWSSKKKNFDNWKLEWDLIELKEFRSHLQAGSTEIRILSNRKMIINVFKTEDTERRHRKTI